VGLEIACLVQVEVSDHLQSEGIRLQDFSLSLADQGSRLRASPAPSEAVAIMLASPSMSALLF